MAHVRPFAAVRYRNAGHDISTLTAPPYDVVSPAERDAFLAENPHNIVALELPEGSTDPDDPQNRYHTAASIWDEWRRTGVLDSDPTPSFYVLEQRYELNGVPIRRKALIAEVGLEPFSAGIVLPHERTLPKALGDRYELIKATGANFSQVFGLFDDAAGETDALYERALRFDPVAVATDADGVESVLWAITDPALIAGFSAVLADKRIFIADGHHRYTTALAYRDYRRQLAVASGHNTVSDPAYNYVMMALVNMEDPDLVVLPTHRVARASGTFDADTFLRALDADFELEAVAESDVPHALDQMHTPAFLIRLRGDDAVWRATLRDSVGLDARIPLDRSSAWKHLDVAVLQELILDPLLDIHPDRPETLERLSFVKDPQRALALESGHDVAFVMRATRMDQLRAVAMAGETMPQKSTYFYPKMLSGLVMRAAD